MPFPDVTGARGNSVNLAISSNQIFNGTTNLVPLLSIIGPAGVLAGRDTNNNVTSGNELVAGPYITKTKQGFSNERRMCGTEGSTKGEKKEQTPTDSESNSVVLTKKNEY